MEGRVDEQEALLPGYDALTRARSAAMDGALEVVATDTLQHYLVRDAHRVYLDNPHYDRYLRMHKVLVGNGGAQQLEQLAGTLATETLPRYLDASGWAYAEAALAESNTTTAHKLELLDNAQHAWDQGIARFHSFDAGEYAQWLTHGEESTPYRMALSLAYLPLMREIVSKNVTTETMRQVFGDTLAIAQSAAVMLNLAEREKDTEAIGNMIGFLHETNALMALLYSEDPCYIPLPASSRADSGYYNQQQSHDIVVINQSWGEVKRTIPIEIKAAASLRDRKRYNALIIRGKMHLIVPRLTVNEQGGKDRYHPATALEAFTKVREGDGDAKALTATAHIVDTVRRLIILYQKGPKVGMQAMKTVTEFHDATKVEAVYPELSRHAQYHARPQVAM